MKWIEVTIKQETPTRAEVALIVQTTRRGKKTILKSSMDVPNKPQNIKDAETFLRSIS